MISIEAKVAHAEAII